MKLDPVHDLQAVFRQLMLAAAFPGTLRRIGERAERIDIDAPLPKPMLALALALLDAETSFAFRSDKDEAPAALVSRLTYARRESIGAADFVFVLDGGERLVEAIEASRTGTLIDPQLGATLVVGVGSLEEGTPIRLEGPGIESGASLRASFRPSSRPDADSAWVAARNEKNKEYPLGIDIFFVDEAGLVCALPRTTRAAGGAAWAT